MWEDGESSDWSNTPRMPRDNALPNTRGCCMWIKAIRRGSGTLPPEKYNQQLLILIQQRFQYEIIIKRNLSFQKHMCVCVANTGCLKLALVAAFSNQPLCNLMWGYIFNMKKGLETSVMTKIFIVHQMVKISFSSKQKIKKIDTRV